MSTLEANKNCSNSTCEREIKCDDVSLREMFNDSTTNNQTARLLPKNTIFNIVLRLIFFQ